MSAVALPAQDLPHALTGGLKGAAHELALLQAHVLRLQDICHVPEHAAGLDSVLVRELQALDLISQRLEVLGAYLRQVAAAVPYDPAVDLTLALASVPLQDMADRLAAHAADEEAPAEAFDSGDFDLF